MDSPQTKDLYPTRVACPSCLTLNEKFRPFCSKCGAPVGFAATVAPANLPLAEGYLLRKAIEGRPRPIVLIGVWVLFFPVLLISVSVAAFLLIEHRDRSDFVFFWLMVGLAYVAFVIVYRVTKNYLTTVPQESEEEETPRNEDSGRKQR